MRLFKRELSHEPSLERTYHIDLVDSEGVVHISFEKNIYIRRKASIKKAYENKDKRWQRQRKKTKQ